MSNVKLKFVVGNTFFGLYGYQIIPGINEPTVWESVFGDNVLLGRCRLYEGFSLDPSPHMVISRVEHFAGKGLDHKLNYDEGN